MSTHKVYNCNLKLYLHFLVLALIGLLPPFQGSAQGIVEIYVKDASNSFSQPFIKITNLTDSSQSLSGINGVYKASPGDKLSFEHFLYKPKTYTVNNADSVQFVFLEPLNIKDLDLSGESAGGMIFKQFQDTMSVKSYKLLPFLKYELVNDFNIYARKRTKEKELKDMNLKDWTKFLSVMTIEENISEGPKKNKLRVIFARAETKDSTIITDNKTTLIPVNLQNISPLSEYITLQKAEFFNPLHPKANKRNNFYYLGNIEFGQNILNVVLSLPKGSKKFASINALLYFDNETKHLKGSSYLPAKSLAPWQLNSDYINLPMMTGLQNNVYFEVFVKKLPKHNVESFGYYYSIKDKLQLDSDSSEVKKSDIRIFQSKKDSVTQVQDEYYNVVPVQESDKLEYLERDSSEDKFVNVKWYDFLANIALENIGWKVGSGYFTNIFKINGYEYLRIGVGYQSLNLISERLRFGGYFGYAIFPQGINDKGWRLGFNTGIYLGKGKRQYLEYNYKNDVLEPGRTFYLYEKKDLIRNFFTSRMGITVSNNVAYTSTVNNNFIFRIAHSNYSFDPQFYYWYKTSPEDSTNFFRFSELSFKMRIGKYSTMNPGISRLLLLKKGFIPIFYINYVEGFENFLKGEYAYRKVNAKMKSYIQFNEKYHLDITTEAGKSTEEIPYPVSFVGAGNITGLASIMVQDAFQTMDLYRYLSDRYVNVFTTFYVNFKAAKKNRMRPQVGLAWNMGWGKLNGDWNIHAFEEGEGIRDYREGFYETGILFTNFLQVRLFGLLRGEFGMGAFYNVGPTDDPRFAFRATYKITTF